MSRPGRFLLALLCAGALATAAWAADEDKVLYPGQAVPASAPAGGNIGNLTLVVGLALAAVGG
jgi:hypothetical protein